MAGGIRRMSTPDGTMIIGTPPRFGLAGTPAAPPPPRGAAAGACTLVGIGAGAGAGRLDPTAGAAAGGGGGGGFCPTLALLYAPYMSMPLARLAAASPPISLSWSFATSRSKRPLDFAPAPTAAAGGGGRGGGGGSAPARVPGGTAAGGAALLLRSVATAFSTMASTRLKSLFGASCRVRRGRASACSMGHCMHSGSLHARWVTACSVGYLVVACMCASAYTAKPTFSCFPPDPWHLTHSI
eukprot:365566-Chlamydomonas_euryale.AAC.6